MPARSAAVDLYRFSLPPRHRAEPKWKPTQDTAVQQNHLNTDYQNRIVSATARDLLLATMMKLVASTLTLGVASAAVRTDLRTDGVPVTLMEPGRENSNFDTFV